MTASDPPIFFASRMSEDLSGFRERVAESGGSRVWLAERDAPDLAKDEVLGACLESVRRAHRFVAYLDGTYGGQDPADVCVLELEIFQAVIAEKPMRVLWDRSVSPDPRLETFLKALTLMKPGVVEEVAGRGEALVRVRDELSRSRSAKALLTRRLGMGTRLFRRLVTYLARGRSIAYPVRNPLPPDQRRLRDVEFLSGEMAPHPRADPGLVEGLLDDAETTDHRALRLSILWKATRHLGSVPYADEAHAEWLSAWNRCLSLWSSAAAWYGLHGHVYMGRLAATNSLLRIRELDWFREVVEMTEEDIHGTRGAVASEYYSLAKMAVDRNDRRILAEEAVRQIELALQGGVRDRSGLIAIRASTMLLLGAPEAAVEQYERVLRLRENEETLDAGRIGEAQAELGFGHFRNGDLRKARMYLEAGVRNLEEPSRGGFTVRAKKKLAVVLLRTGRIRGAIRQLAEAHEIAEDEGLQDQSNIWTRLSAKVSSRFPV